MKLETIILIIFFLFSALLINQPKLWDEYVYLLNGKHFAGQGFFFENIRPPLLPLLISAFYFLSIEQLLIFLPLTITAVLLILIHKYSTFFTKNPIQAVVVTFTAPVFLLFFNRLLTENLSTIFIISSLILLKKYSDSEKDIFLYSSFFIASFAALSRYPLGIVNIILLILYFIFSKKKSLKKLLICELLFFIPIILWINYVGFDAMIDAFKYAGPESGFFYYFINSHLILGVSLFFILIIPKYTYSKNDLWFLVPLLITLLFFQSFHHKENRYLIPMIPFFAIFSCKLLDLKKALPLFSVFLFLTSLYYVTTISSYSYNTGELMPLVNDFFIDKGDVVILTNFMPQCSYYTGKNCQVLSYFPEWLPERIIKLNASYLAVSTIYDHPPYSSNLSNFLDYEIHKFFNNQFETIVIYGVENSWN